MDWIGQARDAGTAAASGVIEEMTSKPDWAQWVIAGFDSGDPEILNLRPDYLSGEWAGESIPEILGLNVGDEWPDGDVLDAIDNTFNQAFWTTMIGTAKGALTSAGGIQ